MTATVTWTVEAVNESVTVHGRGPAARYNCFAQNFGPYCVREPLNAEQAARLAATPGP